MEPQGKQLPPTDMKSQIVIISGASSGIGAACARLFAKAGSKVVCVARRKQKLIDLIADIKKKTPDAQCVPLVADVCDKKALDAAIATLPEGFQQFTISVNNAGLAVGVDRLDSIPQKSLDTMIDTNVKGFINFYQSTVGPMIKNKVGHQINVSSISGTQVYAHGGVYCSTKWAVEALSQTQRLELLKHGIKVTSIKPGLVETEFSIVRLGSKDNADQVYQNMTPLYANDIAETVLFCANRPKHVAICDLAVYPSCQASVRDILRE